MRTLLLRGVLIPLSLIRFFPLAWLRCCGHLFGTLIHALNSHRRHIARTNLQIAFPHLAKDQINALTKRSFRANVTGLLWGLKVVYFPIRAYGLSDQQPTSFFREMHWLGDKKVAQSLAKGHRILLLASHYSYLDVSGWALGRRFPSFIATYKRTQHPVLDRILMRRANYARIVEVTNVRRIKQIFASGTLLWLAVDQAIKNKNRCIPSPFFTMEALSNTVGWRWARITGAEVFVMHAVMRAHDIFQIRFYYLPGFKDMPVQQAIDLQNATLTQAIKTAPEQYDWTFTRFRKIPNRRRSLYSSSYRKHLPQ